MYKLLFSPCLAANLTWFPGPFSTEGRWMINENGQRLTMAGVNWPGAGETMIPEGLQYASIADIVTKIKSIGMNTIRLTWAVEMVDNILDNDGRDVDIATAFSTVLGNENGTKVLNAVIKNNPTFTPETTRLEVFDAIAKECAARQIYLHLDNHVSKAGWCCDASDGNAFFGDTYFDAAKWTRALEYMATHGKSWPNLISMSLRNELRRPASYTQSRSYKWSTWYSNTTTGATAIHAANPALLIYFSGLDLDTQLRPIFAGNTFNKSALAYANKIVLEVHDYDMDGKDTNCTEKKQQLRDQAFEALDPPAYPLVVSEWGFGQAPEQYKTVYASCLREYLPLQRVGWMTWVLGGSYYIRKGVQDFDESWGLLDHGWKGWRCLECVKEGLEPMVRDTLRGLE